MRSINCIENLTFYCTCVTESDSIIYINKYAGTAPQTPPSNKYASTTGILSLISTQTLQAPPPSKYLQAPQTPPLKNREQRYRCVEAVMSVFRPMRARMCVCVCVCVSMYICVCMCVREHVYLCACVWV